MWLYFIDSQGQILYSTFLASIAVKSNHLILEAIYSIYMSAVWTEATYHQNTQHAWKVSQRNQRGKEACRGFEQFEVWKMFWVQTEKKLMTESQNRERTEDLLQICWRSKYQITILEKLRSILNVDFLSFIFQL